MAPQSTKVKRKKRPVKVLFQHFGFWICANCRIFVKR
jgi:hypothetical protein